MKPQSETAKRPVTTSKRIDKIDHKADADAELNAVIELLANASRDK